MLNKTAKRKVRPWRIVMPAPHLPKRSFDYHDLIVETHRVEVNKSLHSQKRSSAKITGAKWARIEKLYKYGQRAKGFW